MSEGCQGPVIQSIYKSGRTGFTVGFGEKGVAITFSGMNGKKPDANSQLQTLDLLIFNLGIEGVDPETDEIDGSCSYSNPHLGPMNINCHATDKEGGGYLLEFRTDGSEPFYN